MRFTKLHINAVLVATVSILGALAAAQLGDSCLAGSVLMAGLGIAAIFAKSGENGDA